MTFRPYKDKHGHWRIVATTNDTDRDLCGAVNELVALQQCAILNAMRRYAE